MRATGSEAADAAGSLRTARLETVKRALAHARRIFKVGTDLEAIERALAADDLDSALRHIDRAWRAAPQSDALTALYSRLLALEARDLHAALRLLQQAPLDADAAALLADTLLGLGQAADAQASLQQGLHRFAVTPGDLLADVASEVLVHRETAAPGWIARLPNLDFVGELKRDESTRALKVRLANGAEFIQPIGKPSGPRRGFQFKLPALPIAGALQIAAPSGVLLGSGGAAIPDFGMSGQSTAHGRRVSGRVRIAWSGQKKIRLVLQDERGKRINATASALAGAGAGDERSFALDLGSKALQGSRIDIAAQLPNGEWQSLPDMPLLLDEWVRLPSSRRPPGNWIHGPLRHRASKPRHRRAVDIVVPVYRGRQETLLCLESILATAPRKRLIVIDDATEDRELAADLDRLAAAGHIVLLRNERNLGFVASVERGMAYDAARDVLLLNADTHVFGRWLERLREVAYGAADVGTVTPFSNSGSIASYPGPGESLMSRAQAAALHELAAATHAGVDAAIPFGVGFCMYIRRDCLNAVGGFDAEVFGKGYGEETDFCLRAAAKRWTHKLAADVFVYHAGGTSFGSQREALRLRTLRHLNLRHPGFDAQLDEFVARDPLKALRRPLDEARLRALPGTFALLVSLALPGGVDRYLDGRRQALADQGRNVLTLRPCKPHDASRCELVLDVLDAPNLHYEIPGELPELTALLESLRIDSIEIQHFLGLDPRVIEAVRALGPYQIVVHDYAWVCPRVTLIDATGRYCGEPDLGTCRRCVAKSGSNLDESIDVEALRQRSGRWFAGATRVTAPTADTARRIERYIDSNVAVTPHGPTRAADLRAAAVPGRRRIKVALLGAIGEHKGYRVLMDCARDAKRRDLPLEFVVVGFTEGDAALRKTGRVFITGRYLEGEAPYLLAREKPDLIFMASVWPETWSYTLDDALTLGVPIVAFDLGGIAERLRAIDKGHILPAAAGAVRINDEMMRLMGKSSLAPSSSAAMMIVSDEQKTGMNANSAASQNDGLSASVQTLPLPMGLYLFSVTSAARATQRAAGNLQIPALHVGLGPGVSTSQVEFVAGPSTESAWLFAQDDCLVTKVKADGVTLVLTSVRGPGGETLSIKVARLDVAAETSPAPRALKAPPKDLPKAAKNGLNGHAKHSRKAPAPAAPPVTSVEAFPVPLEIGAHIRTRGDMMFRDVAWAGRIASGLWIESFMVRPLETFQAGDVEYKGLTGSGFETPWLSDGIMCGTKGMAVPLVGFAIRLKRGRDAGSYDCEYSGYFKSGVVVGPLKNGNPCRSTVANDPLEGIQVSIRKRTQAAEPAPRAAAAAVPKAPTFGRFREPTAGARVKRAAKSSKSSRERSLKRSAQHRG